MSVFITLKISLRRTFFIVSLVLAHQVYSQVYLSETDSLENTFKSDKFNKEDELNLLLELLNTSDDPQKLLFYSNILIEKAAQLDSIHYLFNGHLQKGNAFRMTSDLSKALEEYLIARQIASQSKNELNLAISNITIGDVYSEIGSHTNSIAYYQDGIEMLRTIKSDSSYLATALINYGDEYYNVGEYDKALGLFYESSSICKKIGFKLGSAYNLGNIGMVFAMQNKPKLAEANILEAIQILETEGDYYPISDYLGFISDIYISANQPELALYYADRSLALARKYQLKDEESNANLQLSIIYEQLKDNQKSLYHLKKHIKFKDSLFVNLQKIAQSTTEIEVSKKQIELDLLEQKSKNAKVITYSFLGGFVLVSLLAFGLYRRNRFIHKTKLIIEKERDKSDKLLLNILPFETAKELKKNGKVEAKKFNSVTVLFTDFEGFTNKAEKSSPEKLVETVDLYFSEFDNIIKKYKLEKIKTIGDSYMCAGGLPEHTEQHAYAMAQAAIEMTAFVKKMKQVHQIGELRFDMRIGIHTGPIVAGVVGKDKFSYDIWGDTVNIASRMESTCEIGKINVSESTYQLIKDKFEFESRGQVEVKNRSAVRMYYLSSLDKFK